jgi:hypothetical protein
MRLGQLAIIVPLLAAPAAVSPAPWNGVTPGVTTAAQVEQRFGEPTKRTKKGARTVLAYFAEQAMEGTKQTQFHVDAGGTVQEITVFLATPLDAELIEGKYGKPSQKTFVDSTFQKVWVFGSQGVTVFWAKDGSGAEALSFGPVKGAARAEPVKGEASKGDAAKGEPAKAGADAATPGTKGE